MNFVRPVALFCLDYQLAYPTLLVLSWAKYYFNRSTLSSVRLQFSVFRIHAKINARIRSEIRMEFGVSFNSIGEPKLDTGWLIDSSSDLELVVNRRS